MGLGRCQRAWNHHSTKRWKKHLSRAAAGLDNSKYLLEVLILGKDSSQDSGSGSAKVLMLEVLGAGIWANPSDVILGNYCSLFPCPDPTKMSALLTLGNVLGWIQGESMALLN